MNVVIAGGGTGGHLYPGIAIARELLKQRGNAVMFIGTEQGIEATVLPEEGLPVSFITAGKLKGMGPGAVAKTLLSIPRSLLQSLDLLRRLRPDAVIGVGGYASGPVAIAAWLSRVPLFLIEPNSYAGLANRLAGRLAKKVLLCFPGTAAKRFFPAGSVVELGPLVRTGIDQGDREAALASFGLKPGTFTVLAMGGSGGAHAINLAMVNSAALLKDAGRLQILHQTGAADAALVQTGYRDAGVAAAVFPYIHDMAGAYAAADLVIARSGATTVAELAVCGKPAVLVPYPFAADNHQEFNARTLAARGGAEVILQKDLTPERLAATIRNHAESGPKARSAPKLDQQAVQEIVRICGDHV